MENLTSKTAFLVAAVVISAFASHAAAQTVATFDVGGDATIYDMQGRDTGNATPDNVSIVVKGYVDKKVDGQVVAQYNGKLVRFDASAVFITQPLGCTLKLNAYRAGYRCP